MSIAQRTLDDAPGRPGAGLELNRRERLEAWALTGPPGRVWSFAADLASALPVLARYWGSRLMHRGRPPDA